MSDRSTTKVDHNVLKQMKILASHRDTTVGELVDLALSTWLMEQSQEINVEIMKNFENITGQKPKKKQK